MAKELKLLDVDEGVPEAQRRIEEKTTTVVERIEVFTVEQLQNQLASVNESITEKTAKRAELETKIAELTTIARSVSIPVVADKVGVL